MRLVRRVDTQPELAVRRLLFSAGYRYRLNVAFLPGRPDVVFLKRRKIIFVHGCFWHRHGCRRTTTPRSRSEYWSARFVANTDRDERVERELRQFGWDVLTVWECETKDEPELLATLRRFLDDSA